MWSVISQVYSSDLVISRRWGCTVVKVHIFMHFSSSLFKIKFWLTGVSWQFYVTTAVAVKCVYLDIFLRQVLANICIKYNFNS